MSRRLVALVTSVAMIAVVSACGRPDAVSMCSDRVPVAVVTQTVREEADIVGSGAGASLEFDLDDTIGSLALVAEEAPTGVASEAEVLVTVLTALRDALSGVDWDLVRAAEDEQVQGVLQTIDSSDVQVANLVVESYLSTSCGARAIGEDDPTVSTLPSPTIAGTVPDPPLTGLADNESDIDALGSLVGSSFGLTLSAEQVRCLGRELQDLVDASNENASSAAYQRQFQRAFDACGIDFEVPVE